MRISVEMSHVQINMMLLHINLKSFVIRSFLTYVIAIYLYIRIS